MAALVAVVPPLVFGGAWGEWVYRALALLLIGCPCALVISVPASITSALSTGARNGLLMKACSLLSNHLYRLFTLFNTIKVPWHTIIRVIYSKV